MPVSALSGLPAGTYTVSRLAWEIRGLLADTFRSVWLAGEVQRLHSAPRGQLYFELIEKGQGDRIQAKLDCVLWADERAVVEEELREAGVELAEGVALRCRGDAEFWVGGGRLQFTVREVDPFFSLGALEQRRRETLRALEAEGLLERNRRFPLSPAPLEIGLITSGGSAAYHDFLDTLQNSGLGFRLTLVHSAVQGAAAEDEIDRAFRRLHVLVRAGRRLDAIVLIRGGGSRSDLAAFDSRRVARAVARAPAPTICGIGHQIDTSIADLVAHTSCKTPTEAAEFLVGRVGESAARLEEARRGLALQTRDLLRTAKQRVASVPLRLASPSRALLRHRAVDVQAVQGALMLQARGSLRAAVQRVTSIAPRLASPSRALLGRRAVEVRALRRDLERAAARTLSMRTVACRYAARRARTSAERLTGAAAKQAEARREALIRVACQPVERADERLQAQDRLCRQLSPERTLARGFSITRRADGGLVRRLADAAPGVELRTRLSDGTVASTVDSGGAQRKEKA